MTEVDCTPKRLLHTSRLSLWLFSRLLAASALCALPVAPMAAQETGQPFAPAASPSPAPAMADSLATGFRDPPDSARPRVWWHWISGNVSRDGIRKDMEWMRRSGIAGAMMFDGDPGAPQIVPKRVTVLSPEWYEDIKFASDEASRLGLEFSMAAAPGWSETGGPWVTPEMGMKKFVWSETRVDGGRRVGGLTPLPNTPGPFQDVPAADIAKRADNSLLRHAWDVAVLAYREPEGDVSLRSLKPKVTASDPTLDVSKLIDGALSDKVTLPSPSTTVSSWVRFDFDRPRTMRALTYAGPLGARFANGPLGRIEVSDDGETWRVVRSVTGQAHAPAPQRTFAFAATTGKHFRVTFERGVVSRDPWPKRAGIMLSELALVPGARVDLFEDRAGFGVLRDTDAVETPPVTSGAAIAATGVIDVTKRLRGDGTLDWTPPAGRWIIMRTGYSLTGELNHPATPEGTGLEVDKLNASHVKAHLNAYLLPVLKTTALGDGANGLRYILTDSWEAQQENWTESMVSEFRTRRGYDPTPYLPVLAGRVVGSAEASDAFLWDFRRTLSELVAVNHYGTITRFAKAHGLGYYGEATGAAWPTVADGMLAKSATDIPMGEFWAMPFGGKPSAFQGARSDEFPADIIETRSTAHVYGKPLVAAEALTSSLPQWTSTPWSLKWVADKYLAMGVNRLVLHTSPHQPDDRAPGLSLAPFGQVFTRHETWAEMSRPWIDYLARCSFLLQQGQPVADLLYFYGEGAPSGVPYDSDGDPAGPRGYGFDYVNADALLRLARVVDGRITFPSGAVYKVLVLPKRLRSLTLPLAMKLRDLVRDGAVVLGPKPTRSPSLQYETSAVAEIINEIWGQADGRALTVNSLGKGRVYWHADPIDVLAREGLARDFDYTPSNPMLKLEFSHRRVDDGDIYFVTNQSGATGEASLRLRATGHAPEIWNAEDGSVRSISYRTGSDTTELEMEIAPYQSFFVVMRKKVRKDGEIVPVPRESPVATINGAWAVDFAVAGRIERTTRSTGSWTTDSDPDIRFFSGTAIYSKKVEVRAGWLRPDTRMILELGNLGDVAEVSVNGNKTGIAWLPPYRVDVTDQLRPGANALVIRVANTWQNRFVGDLQPAAKKRAFTNAPAGIGAFLAKKLSPDTPLTPSGLLGPVRLISIRNR